MGDNELHSLVLASDYRVDDIDRMWSLAEERRDVLAGIGAHHIVIYTSIYEPGRILATVGIHHRLSVSEVVRSPAIFEWFDMAGVIDIPAIFAGEIVQKIDVQPSMSTVASVIVGAVTTVDDVDELVASVHEGHVRLTVAGIRKVWVYRAFDDPHEVMMLHEVKDEASTLNWIDHPEVAAAWLAHVGHGAYPNLFVGRLSHLLTLDEKP
ncbi:MAG: fatty-acid--CoA ligase [Mycobacterium sp.]